MKSNGFARIIFIVAIIIAAAVIMSSCSPNEHHRGPAPVSTVATLFKCSIVWQDSSDIVNGLFTKTEHYCYAKDKFDADRMFTDSLGLDTLTCIKEYTIYEMAPINKPFTVIK